MSDWLYPLSAASGRYFVESAGFVYPDTSFDSFEAMIRQGATDDWWSLSTNYRKVNKGDRVWCYYGVAGGDRGVVGLAIARAIEHDEPAGVHNVHLGWRLGATRRLLKTPVPAARVREFVPSPRRAVQALSPHPELVEDLEKAAGL